ncbi:alpha-L-fucosidase [Pedobacter riviphilus]|uniref:alpha-L-fucosidase n=2 Tax=Pedobacter riviphilus TaxID=2766984 RepID=A0ABX6TNQ3_9SPHI|nr:alpha-L-fucosidase [Pedobacter riviphilus]
MNAKYNNKKNSLLLTAIMLLCHCAYSQTMPSMWDSRSNGKEHPNLKWFKDAKFGIFIHWGLYSKLAGEWQSKRYYGSGEWLMYQAKISAKDYGLVAGEFNPLKFNATEWVDLIKSSGARYMVVTAKHHEGFAMFDSKVSDFSITKASPYGKDVMKELSGAAANAKLPFGFYYSQFLDWHEPNGGGNDWDFKQSKDYHKYYEEKSIPQLKELLTNYGKLGMVWFDMPGGLNKQETQFLVDDLHKLQPQTLFSSRVGQGLGDYMDFGDSEMPAEPIAKPWEAIYTFNDSWGYIAHDQNFKTSSDIIRLIATASSKGGNLMLNIGPDGDGSIPQANIDCLKSVGRWLKVNGESIYASIAGFIPAQPWGVTTSKPGKLYLHIFQRPNNGKLLVPGFSPKAISVSTLAGSVALKWRQTGEDLEVTLPNVPVTGLADEVLTVSYAGKTPDYQNSMPITVSAAYESNELPVISAQHKGATRIETLTYNHYFGDWKHVTVLGAMKSPADSTIFTIRALEPGYYKIYLDYVCPSASAGQEGKVTMNGREFNFKTLSTCNEINSDKPVSFIKHAVGVINLPQKAIYKLAVTPLTDGKELFKIKNVLLEADKP